ncbi:MAG: sulfotransferase family 2 domain-containing protein [Limnothrix sp.]
MDVNSEISVKNKFIIFLHVQKTGGITIQRILRRKLGKSIFTRALNLFKSSKPSSVIEEFESKTLRDKYIVGHFCYGIHQHLPKPSCYASFLREPVSRIISLYEYSASNPTAYYHQQAKNHTLEEFALHAPLMELDNGQVRFIAGDQDDHFINRTPIGECDELLLETAIDNIERHFIFVGLTEYFDQSLLLMKEIFEWNSCLYLRRNVTKKSKKTAVSPELRKKIAEKNELDTRLYEYVEKRLKEQLKEYSLNDQSVLQDFQEENLQFNQSFGQFYSAYDFLKSVVRGKIGRPS